MARPKVAQPLLLVLGFSQNNSIHTIGDNDEDSDNADNSGSAALLRLKTMKSKQTLLLLIILFCIPLSHAQKLKIHANPINIASQLVLDTDSANIASTLIYYGYSLQSTDNAKTVYQHPDGTFITISFPNISGNPTQSGLFAISGNGRRATGDAISSSAAFPTIQVKSKVSEKELKKILEDMNFQKVGTCYEHDASRYSSYIPRCIPSSKSVTFQRLKK